MAEVTTLDKRTLFEKFFKETLENRNKAKQMAIEEKRSFITDFVSLSLFDDELARLVLEKPDECLAEAEEALRAVMKIQDEHYAEVVKWERLYLRLKGLPEKTFLRAVGAKHIERLVCFDGIVVRSTPVRPFLVEAIFKCRCGTENRIPQTGLFLRTPRLCENPSCRRESGFELVPEKSKFLDSQDLRVQERPEDLPPGQLPRHLEVSALDDIVDVARPGDRITVTGIVRAKPEVIPGKGRLRTFNVSVDANYIETVGKELEEVSISPEEEMKILKIAKSEFVHKDIIDSIAPSIYGYEDIKEAIMYLLFSGVPKTTYDGVTIRGDIHTLLVGDPGTAKSQLLRYVARISPRGLYTTGRGTTAAGLTAAVLRERAGGMVLEAGALVLADKGVAAVDEIDKMRDEDRVAMHEMMEQQTVSVAKGGIIATLNARASILAAANPKFGRYEDRLVVVENINIPIVILSRFDLIFILKDIPEKELDEKLSQHILNVHRTGGTAAASPIPPELLRKYISYAKTRIQPKLSEEAVKHLRGFYLKMRKQSGGAEGSPIAITPRQLEALVRIAEARAKIALRQDVTKMDAEAAIRIVKRSLRDVGALGEAEVADIDILMTGKTTSEREGLTITYKLLGELERAVGEVDLNELYKRLDAEHRLERSKVDEYIKRLLKEGSIYSPRPGFIKRTRA